MTRPRAVSFEAKPAYSRLPHDDEKYVMKAFAKHATHCKACANPYQTHLAGETLCSRGHRRALDVAQYVYVQAGNAYSVVDRDGREGQRRQEVQIEIPAGCEAVRGLLRAMDRGLRIIRERESATQQQRGRHQRRQTSLESMDSTYYVAPRTAPAVHQSRRHQRSASNESSDSTGSANSSRSAADSLSSRSSVESVPSSAIPSSPRQHMRASRSDRSRYYTPTWGYEAQPQQYAYAQPLQTIYVPQQYPHTGQAYYAYPAYHSPRRSGVAVWA